MITQSSQRDTVYSQKPLYFSSESGHSNWGQPPASWYVFSLDGNRLSGHLIHSPNKAFASPSLRQIDPLLELEVKAWEAASDEDWLTFESRLD